MKRPVSRPAPGGPDVRAMTLAQALETLAAAALPAPRVRVTGPAPAGPGAPLPGGRVLAQHRGADGLELVVAGRPDSRPVESKA